jgi:septation ring formation regulator EzrA
VAASIEAKRTMTALLRRDGWGLQAKGLATVHRTLAGNVVNAAEKFGGWPKPKADEAFEPSEDARGADPRTRELELAHQLDIAQTRISDLERFLAREATAKRVLIKKLTALEAAVEAGNARASDLENEIEIIRDSQEIARAIENTNLQEQTAREKDAEIEEATARIQFLQAALDAAERECSRRADDIAYLHKKLHEKSETSTERTNSIYCRAFAAEQLLKDVSAYLTARAARSGALEQAASTPGPAPSEAEAENNRLRALLYLKRLQMTRVEHSRETLLADTKVLLTFLKRITD